MEDDSFLQTIAALRSATSAAELWPAAFDSICDFMGAGGMLLGRLPHAGGAFELAGHRLDSEIVARINGPLASRTANPVFGAVPRAPVLQPVIASSVIDERTLLGSRAYDEAMRPAGLRYCIATVLACDAERSYALAFGRNGRAGDFDRDDARRFAALSPHVLGAVHAQHLLALAKGEAGVLDLLDRGVVALDGAGRPLFMNREAERIFAADDGLRATRNGLQATCREDHDRLRALLGSGAGIRVASRALAVHRPSGRPPYSLVLAPLAATAPPVPAFGRRHERILFLRDPARRTEPRREWLIQLYGLTRSEAAVALDLFAGSSPGEIAARRGNSANTVKTHIKAVFAKTGVARQAELVALIGAAVGDLRF